MVVLTFSILIGDGNVHVNMKLLVYLLLFIYEATSPFKIDMLDVAFKIPYIGLPFKIMLFNPSPFKYCNGIAWQL
jgi:hypothetical protein